MTRDLKLEETPEKTKDDVREERQRNTGRLIMEEK